MPGINPPPLAATLDMDRTASTNPIMQIEHSDGELDRRPSSTTTQAKEILHTEILSTESAMPKSEPPPAPKDTTTTANPGTPIGCPDGELDGQRLGELLLEGTPIGFSHSKSPKTDSVCELNLKKVQQSEREGGDRALTPLLVVNLSMWLQHGFKYGPR